MRYTFTGPSIAECEAAATVHDVIVMTTTTDPLTADDVALDLHMPIACNVAHPDRPHCDQPATHRCTVHHDGCVVCATYHACDICHELCMAMDKILQLLGDSMLVICMKHNKETHEHWSPL